MFLSYLWINAANINSEIWYTIKNHFTFYPVQKQETNWNFTGSHATFYDCINTIYQFLKPFLDKKCIFEEYGAFKVNGIMKTGLYNVDPLKPNFYVVKLGFTGIYIIFSYFCSKTKIVSTH